MIDRRCEAIRYRHDAPCGPADFDVVYRSTDGKELDRHPACFTHGLLEVEAHQKAAGMSSCDLEEVG